MQGLFTLADHGIVMTVVVVAVVVAVGVLVLERIVPVPVPVLFGDVQIDAQREERGRPGGPGVERAIAHRPGYRGAHEWRGRKDGTGSGRADVTLRVEVQA